MKILMPRLKKLLFSKLPDKSMDGIILPSLITIKDFYEVRKLCFSQRVLIKIFRKECTILKNYLEAP